MAEDRIKEKIVPEEPWDREWTLMFYFASDNPLASSIVNQLKALKGAGFHGGVNVVAHFDPYIRDTPSHVFEVNVVEKLKRRPGESDIGFASNNLLVRKLVLDRIWEEDETGNGKKVREKTEELLVSELKNMGMERDARKLPVLPGGWFNGERSPGETLGAFLEFCRRKYPAKRYMLFILGHGVVVGNDVFLFDSNPGDDSDADEDDATLTPPPTVDGASGKPAAAQNKPRRQNSLSLRKLGRLLTKFKTDIGESKFDLLSFHSCSMSGAEVLYELQNTANYMLASQGPAFVGSWPYRQILLRIFKSLGTANNPKSPGDADVRKMVVDIFHYVVHNSYDFYLAGYSFDVALCDLTKASKLGEWLDKLARALIEGLGGRNNDAGLADMALGSPNPAPLARELILLAHWDAQSFWQGNYVDLYDFCLRLSQRCALVSKQTGWQSQTLTDIVTACGKVIEVLEKGADKNDAGSLVMRSEFVGAEYQYTHGLSIFFPWAKPADRFFEQKYIKYALVNRDEPAKAGEPAKAPATAWAEFLDLYFARTRRTTRAEEEVERNNPGAILGLAPEPAGRARAMGADVVEKNSMEMMQVISGRVFDANGELAKTGDDQTGPPGKVGGDDPTGAADCGCPSFKNHPAFTGVNREQVSETFGEGIGSVASAV